MKKIATALTIIMMLFSFTACSSANTVQHEMYIQKAELTEEEKAILEFVGSEKPPYILDFAVNDTVQSLQINTYELQADQWKLIAGGGGQELKEPKSRIALTFDNIGLGLRSAVEHKGSSYYQSDNEFEFEGLDSTTSYLTEQTSIEFEKEIPLVIQIHTSKNNISSLSPEYGFYEPKTYADAGYEKVYAITCLFSQKTVNELSQQTMR